MGAFSYALRFPVPVTTVIGFASQALYLEASDRIAHNPQLDGIRLDYLPQASQ